MAIKECVICGSQFDARGRTKTCSKICSDRAVYLRNYQRRKEQPGVFREYSKKANMKRRTENPDKFKEYNRNWMRDARAADPEKFRQRERDARAADPEKFRQRERDARAADPERFRVYKKKSYTINIVKERERSRLYARDARAADPEKFRERDRHYRNSQSAAASMLEACAAMMQINERGNNHETE